MFSKVFDKIASKINSAAVSALNTEADSFASILREEVPVRDGNLQKSIEVIPAKVSLGGIVAAQVSIGGDKAPHARAIEYGIQAGQDGSIHNAAPGGWMVFESWESGPDELRWADGKFHFKQVKHNSPPNDYVGRTMVRYNRKSHKAFVQKIKEVIFK